MRPARTTLALAVAAGALAGVPPAAPAAAVDLMVVGKERVLQAPKTMRLKKRKVRVGARRCTLGRATPLAALAGIRLRLRLKDYGSCGRAARDSGGLYVRRVARDGARGSDGWVYKVGRRAGTGGAADLAGPFGRGGLRDGQRLLWFYCRKEGADGSCQRTLEVAPQATTVAAGETLRVTVRGYDDAGRGVPVEGATVSLGTEQAVTGAGGAATLTAPAQAGGAELVAVRDGMVRSFAQEVTVR